MPKLVHSVNRAFYREYPLSLGKLTVGRNPENDVQLDDDAVSGEHFMISVIPSQYMDGMTDVWAEDLKSTNGTKVNGSRISRLQLQNDDVVKVGTHEFRFVNEVMTVHRTTRILIEED